MLRQGNPIYHLAFVAVFGFAIYLGVVTAYNPVMKHREDIYYVYLEGKRITEGINPYSRIHEGDMINNDKYATYLPLSYLISAGAHSMGLSGKHEWLLPTRIVLIASYVLIGVLIYGWLSMEGLGLWGLFGAVFWFFNRWSIKVLHIVHIDFLPVLLILVALMIVSKHPRTALVCLGISLSLKHIGVLILPLFYPEIRRHNMKLTTAILWLSLVPFVTSLPFMIWDLTGYVKSILFSVTRHASDHFRTPSIGKHMKFVGSIDRIFMFGLISLVWVTVIRNYTGLLLGVFLIFLVFISFNAVLFVQYMVWLIPFALILPLAIKEHNDIRASL